jgi:hypothetical protein
MMCDHTDALAPVERGMSLCGALDQKVDHSRSPDSRRSAHVVSLTLTPLGSTNHWRERRGPAIAPLEGVQSGVGK